MRARGCSVRWVGNGFGRLIGSDFLCVVVSLNFYTFSEVCTIVAMAGMVLLILGSIPVRDLYWIFAELC